ncbi:MAG: glycosyltransferase domain-containing protein [Candidatus Omnitrophota bacterium]|jgi:glycosyltransferase involved in cell wall biosynthesis
MLRFLIKIFVFLLKCIIYLLNTISNWRSKVIIRQRTGALLINPIVKVVVYTAIFGDKDRLREVRKFPGIDYICFTDDETLTSKTWKIEKIKGTHRDPRMNAKIYKILPHHFFQNYEYSLWVDGTHTPIVDIRFLIHKFLNKEDIAVFSHPRRRCVYEEMEVCIRYNKDDAEVIRKQEEKLRSENYPENNGLATCTVILRKHNVPKVREAMEDWWREINRYSIRDQLSFNYIAYRNNLNYAVILPGDVYNNHFFEYIEHLRPDRLTLSIGWILNGTIETASSRIMGYNIHEYLVAKNISSRILYRPESRIISNLNLPKEQIDDILNTNINILILVKIDSGENLDYIIRRCKKRNIKVVYSVCDLPSKKMSKKADAIIATSNYYSKIIPRKYHNKLYIAFDGYEQPQELYKIHNNERKIKLCFVSNQVWDEFPYITELPKDVCLKIIGPNKEILTSSFKNSLVFKKSKFDFEYVTWDLKTVYEEILACDVGIIPWPKMGIAQRIKSFNRLVMFMALGMPVITSPIPSYLGIIRHKENGFIAKTPDEWMDYIIFLRDNPEKREEIGRKAREDVVNKYSKEKQGVLYLEIFKKILTKTNDYV